MGQRTVSVPASRLPRWIDGFHARHGGDARVTDGALVLDGTDGSRAVITPPFALPAGSAYDMTAFVGHVAHPPRCAVILVRRGGMAATIVDGGALEASKVGKRHVQGRTAAGGWSQQRFARRREKQANELVEAAAGYVADIIVPRLPVEYVVTGGDRALVEQVLADPRLRPLAGIPRGPVIDVPDPSKEIVASLPERLSTARIDITDP